MQVTTGPVPTKKKLFTADDMSMVQQDLSLSNQQVKTLAEDMRKASGVRNLFEPSLREKIVEKNQQLQDFFEVKICTLATVEGDKKRENFEQHVATCRDLNGLVEKVIQERNINEERMLIKIGLDGGGGFMKICLSIFKINDDPTSNITPKSNKRLRKRFKNSSVKKVFIIGVVPDIQENCINVKRLWLECGIDAVSRPFTIATDLKLCNILLGLMSHSSSHPCCWCDIKKENLG